MNEENKIGELERLNQPTWIENYPSHMYSLRAMLQLVPLGVGSAVDVFVSGVAQNFTEKRMARFIDVLIAELKQLDEQSVRSDWIKSEEFMDLLSHAVESSLKSRNREKAEMNVKILCNVIGIENNDNYRPEEYIAAIEDLTPLELSVIKTMYEASQISRTQNQNDLQFARETKWKEKVISQCNVNEQDVFFVMKRLERCGFIAEVSGAFYGYTGGDFIATDALTRFMEYLNIRSKKETA